MKYSNDTCNLQCFPNNPRRTDWADFQEFTRDEEENRVGIINWCQCENCVSMPTNIESICCKEIANAEPYMENRNCITERKEEKLHTETSPLGCMVVLEQETDVLYHHV